MLITEYVEIEITTFNKDYLRKKGYIFTKYGEKIKIKVIVAEKYFIANIGNI